MRRETEDDRCILSTYSHHHVFMSSTSLPQRQSVLKRFDFEPILNLIWPSNVYLLVSVLIFLEMLLLVDVMPLYPLLFRGVFYLQIEYFHFLYTIENTIHARISVYFWYTFDIGTIIGEYRYQLPTSQHLSYS